MHKLFLVILFLLVQTNIGYCNKILSFDIGVLFPNNNNDGCYVDNGVTANVSVGYKYLQNSLFLQLNYQYINGHYKSNYNIVTPSINVRKTYNVTDTVFMYGQAGVGGSLISSSNSFFGRGTVIGGFGFMFKMTEHLYSNVGARYYTIFNEAHNFDTNQIVIGVHYE